MQSLILSAWLLFGAIAPFTERGVIDFDALLDLVNPYGCWVENPSTHLYVYQPFAPSDWIPLVDGQWIYSDYGWFWKGNEPHQWATSHWGYWKRNSDGVWGWIPSSEWHTNPVDWRGTKTHIGWRSSPLNKMGDFTESEEKRVLDANEWVFVRREDFGKPMNRTLIFTGEMAKEILIDSYPLSHEIELYRVIARAGPDPLGMPDVQPPKNVNSTTPIDPEKVRYFVTMSLPTYWTPIPVDARPEQIYVFRPKFFQDNDGIQRRIKIWNNPKERLAAVEKVNQALGVTEEPESTKTSPVPKAVAIPKSSPSTPTPVAPNPEKTEESAPKKSSFRSRS